VKFRNESGVSFCNAKLRLVKFGNESGVSFCNVSHGSVV